MATVKLKNNAIGYLSTAISASDVGAALETGDGARFPTLTGDEFFFATISSTLGTYEVVKVTARSVDSLTIVRAQEGTSAASFAAGARVEMRITAQSITDAIKFHSMVSVRDFGAIGDGTTDDTTAIQAALNYVAPLGYTLYFPPGTYRTTATVGFSRADTGYFGVRIVGSGSLKTSIYADHLAGPVLSLNRSNALIQDISLSASAARTAGAAGSNYGLLMEAADTAASSVASMSIIQVRVISQPNHGIVHVGTAIESYYQQVLVQSNKGHGYVFDCGQITSRTNEGTPGIVTLINCWATGNTGHGLKIGDPSDVSAVPYRFMMINCEFSENALTAGVRISADEVWVRGVNMVFDTCAMGTVGSAVIGNIRFAGENLFVRNHRAITAVNTLRLEEDHVLATTFGIRVDGLRVLNQAQNPVVVVSDLTKVRDINVATYGHAGNMTTMFTTGSTRASWDLTPPVSDIVKTSAQTVNDSTTLVDDTQLAIYLAASESVYFEAVIRHIGNSTADIKIAFTAPTSATIRWDNNQSIYVNTSDVVTISSGEIIQGATRSFGASTTARTINIRGWVVMSTTAGALQLQFAQATADVVDTQILPGSTLRVIRRNTNV